MKNIFICVPKMNESLTGLEQKGRNDRNYFFEWYAFN